MLQYTKIKFLSRNLCKEKCPNFYTKFNGIFGIIVTETLRLYMVSFEGHNN